MLLINATLSAQTNETTADSLVEDPNELPSDYSLWSEMMQKIHPGYTSPTTASAAMKVDSDGDGKSDLREAHAFTDPVVVDRDLSVEEQAAMQVRLQEQSRAAVVSREARQAAARAFAEPWQGGQLEPLEPGQDFSPEALWKEQQRRIAEILPAMQAESAARMLAAEEAAQRRGWAKQMPRSSGGTAVLTGTVTRGVPEYLGSDNLDAAKTIAADKLWPGAPLNYNLQGGYLRDSGLPSEEIIPLVRLGVWEVGRPLVQHQAFGRFSPGQAVTLATSRVTDMEPSPPSTPNPTDNDHATHVSGTISSRGLVANTGGMASFASIHSRDTVGDYVEILGLFQPGNEDNRFYASNHSYGVATGWTDIFYYGTPQTPNHLPPAGYYPYWSTDTLLSGGQEDYRWGFYSLDQSWRMDDAVYRSRKILPVWSAGNERGDTGLLWHWENNPLTGQLILVNTPRPDDGYFNLGYDTLPPNGVAKNVLTVTSVNDVPSGWVSSSSASSSSFASWGPPDYGHIKPDVAANGEEVLSAKATSTTAYDYDSGTSMAAPGVTGTLGLLIELLQRQEGPDYEPDAALLKALVIAGTDDLETIGPDYKTGWGLVNARKSAEIVSLNGVSGGQHIRRATVQNGVSGSFSVKAFGNSTPLIVTAVWLDLPGTVAAPQLDPDGVLPTTNQSTSLLKNDIDVKVTRNSTTWYPPSLNPDTFTNLDPTIDIDPDYNLLPGTGHATYTGPNHRDTVEKIIIPQPGAPSGSPLKVAPTAGQDYTVSWSVPSGVTLRNENGQAAPQDLFIVLSGIQTQGTIPFRIVWFEETATNQVTLLWSSVPGSTYWVQSSDTLAAGSWGDVGGSNVVATSTFTAKGVAKSPAQPHRFYRIRKA